jgi:hypothetical protein
LGDFSDTANGKNPSKCGQQLSEDRGVMLRKTWTFGDSAVRYNGFAKITKYDAIGCQPGDLL